MRRSNELLKERARTMRRNPTKAEKLLWNRLKGIRKDGLRFRRQHELYPYIVDLICIEALLIVEVDGENHQWQGEKDAQRREQLQNRGFRIMRFTNFEVLSNPRSCVLSILRAAYSAVPRLQEQIDSIPVW